MRHVLIEDIDEARDLWKEFQDGSGFTDLWPGDDHTYWRLLVRAAAPKYQQDIGMCSAVVRHDKGYVYLSYAIIGPQHRGAGLQCASIRHRLRWAKREGAVYATTYATHSNYASIMNLIRCGFRFAHKPTGWAGVDRHDVHYFERQL
jgi:hypothetical protein